MADYDRFNEVAQEEQKWWQKTWFIVFMLFFFFPAGVFLMYKYSNKTVAKVLAACFVLYCVYASFAKPTPAPSSTPATIPQASSSSTTPSAPPPMAPDVSVPSTEAFQTWNGTVQSYLKSVDSDWEELWKGTANSLGNQSIDRYTAYNNIDQLEKRLESARDKFTDLHAPDGVSSEQKDALNKANSDYVAWIYCRREACQKFKDMLNAGTFPPAKVKEVTDTIKQGDTFAIQAAASILDVERQLGLLK